MNFHRVASVEPHIRAILHNVRGSEFYKYPILAEKFVHVLSSSYTRPMSREVAVSLSEQTRDIKEISEASLERYVEILSNHNMVNTFRNLASLPNSPAESFSFSISHLALLAAKRPAESKRLTAVINVLNGETFSGSWKYLCLKPGCANEVSGIFGEAILYGPDVMERAREIMFTVGPNERTLAFLNYPDYRFVRAIAADLKGTKEKTIKGTVRKAFD